MAKVFQANVVSADRTLFEGAVSMVSVGTVSGELGILAGHAPLLAKLKESQLRLIKEDGSEEVIYASGGVVEVQPNLTLILIDEAKLADELDLESVQAAKVAAEQKLRELMSQNRREGVDYSTAFSELDQATAQLAMIQRSKK